MGSTSQGSKMITQSPDTHPRMEELQVSLIRSASTARRISSVRSLSESAIRLSRRAIKRANPDLNEKELNLKFVSYHYGEDLADLLHEYMDKGSL